MSTTAAPTEAYAPPPAAAAPAAAASRSAVRGTDIVALGTWMALAGALAELLVLAVEKWGLGWTTGVNPHVVWMAPLVLLVLFVPPALVLALAAERAPRLAPLIPWQAVAWGFAFLASLNLTLMSTRLEKYATLILAVGMATQVARWIGPHRDGFVRLTRRSSGWMLALFAALGAIVTGGPMLAERRALAALPAAPAGAPNVLLVVLDAVRFQSMSLSGYARPTTPRLDELARRGVTFDNAITTATWTLPTHASIMTGRWAHELSTNWDSPLDGTYPTLAEALAKRGYRTGGFTGNFFYTIREFGLARGFSHFEDFLTTPGEMVHASALMELLADRPQLRRALRVYDIFGRKPTREVGNELVRWLDRGERRPYFAFLNLYDAHDPYLPRAPFDTLFGPVAVRGNERIRVYGREGGRRDKEKLSPAGVEGIKAAYEGAIAQIDHDFAAMLDSLRARGALDNTIVIVTADHGELFGEHKLFEHGKAPYMPLIHAPLLVVWPTRVPQGARVPQAVSVHEIPATVMSLVTGERDSTFPGASLQRFWSGGPTAVDEPVLSDLAKESAAEKRVANSKKRALSLVLGRYHYLRFGAVGHGGREMLFEYAADPTESHDLAADPALRGTLERMRAATDSLRPPPRGGGGGAK